MGQIRTWFPGQDQTQPQHRQPSRPQHRPAGAPRPAQPKPPKPPKPKLLEADKRIEGSRVTVLLMDGSTIRGVLSNVGTYMLTIKEDDGGQVALYKHFVGTIRPVDGGNGRG